MKKQVIILGLFLFILNDAKDALGYEKVYLQRPSSSYSSSFGNRNYLPSRRVFYNMPYRPTYNPYGQSLYYNNANPSKKLIRRMRLLRRIKNNAYNYLSFDILRNFKPQGTPTGWSTPITSDAGGLLDPNYNINSGRFNRNNAGQGIKSPTVQTDIFVLPGMGNSSSDNKGNKNNDTGGIAGRTGVTIIYD